jgi:hypothetical protein
VATSTSKVIAAFPLTKQSVVAFFSPKQRIDSCLTQ